MLTVETHTVHSVMYFALAFCPTLPSSSVPPMFTEQWTRASAKSIWGAMIKYQFRRVIDFPPAAAKELNTEGSVQILTRISVQQEIFFSVLLSAQCTIFTAELTRQTTHKERIVLSCIIITLYFSLLYSSLSFSLSKHKPHILSECYDIFYLYTKILCLFRPSKRCYIVSF